MLTNIKIKEKEIGHKTTVEPFILAEFVKLKDNMHIVELGCGNGILSILLAIKKKINIIGIDIQDEYLELAKENVELNKNIIKGDIKISKVDIREASKNLGKNFFDVVVTNPPFYKCKQGKQSLDMSRSISRQEILCTFDEIARETSRLLKNRGAFYFLHITERIGEIFEILRRYRLEVKEMQVIYPKVNVNSTHILIKAVKNAKPSATILKPLIISEWDKEQNKK